MRIKRKHNSINSLLLWIYALFVIWRVLYSSNFVIEFGGLLNLFSMAVKLAIVAVSLFAIVTSQKFRKNELLIDVALVVTSFAALLRNDYDVVFLTILMVVAMRRIDFRSIVSYTMYGQIAGALLVLLSCGLGLIGDFTYNHQMLSGGVMVSRTVHTYGFTYYTSPAYLMLAIMMEWNFLHFDKIKVVKILGWGVVQYVIYQLFTSRASFYMSAIYLVLLLLFSAESFKMKNWIWKAIAALGFGGLLILNFALVNEYASGNVMVIAINTLVSGRLFFAAQALEKYGISLLGGHIPMVGGYEVTYGISKEYFYLDSGYLYSLLCYGLLITVLLVIAYTVIFVNVAQTRNKSVYCWLLVFMIINLNNNMFVSVHYVPLLFLLPHALTQGKKSVQNYARTMKQRSAKSYE